MDLYLLVLFMLGDSPLLGICLMGIYSRVTVYLASRSPSAPSPIDNSDPDTLPC